MENTDRIYSKLKSSIGPFIGPLMLLIIGLLMLSLSWLKWPDILIDFGRELYIPWTINNGAVLYRDIAYFNGPFSPYLNSLLFKIFGTHLLSIALFNILLIILLTWIIYHIFLITTDKVVAVATGATFLAMFAFSQYGLIGNYNFVCPYSHELTHGIFLSFLSIYVFSIYLKQRKDRLLLIIGILNGFVFLTKMEVSLAISIALLLGILFVLLINKSGIEKGLKILGLFFIGLFLPVILFIVYLSNYMPFNKVLSSITASYNALFGTSVISNIFYQRITGMDDPRANVIKLLLILGWYIAMFLALIFIAYIWNHLSGNNARRIFIYTLLCIWAFSIQFIKKIEFWFNVFRPLPLLMILLGVYIFMSLLRFRDNREKINCLLPLFVITMFGFFLLLKMILNVHIVHYGFTLALPATLLSIMLLLYQFPMFLEKIFGEDFFYRYLGLILVLIILVFHINYSRGIYNLKTFAISSGKETIISFKPEILKQGPIFKQALYKIRNTLDKNDNFIVLPEGVMLNYLSRRQNPTPYINFMPPELLIFGEDKILDSFVKNKPDYVLLVERDTSEYGYQSFGKDYGAKIYTWVKENYLPVSVIGNEPFSGKGFGISINKYMADRAID